MRKYKALHRIASIFKVLGWVVLIVGSIRSIYWGVAARGVLGLEGAIWKPIGLLDIASAVIASVVYGLLLLAAADIFHILIDIRASTSGWRRQYLTRRWKSIAPSTKRTPGSSESP